jgi:hypothetical protein
MSAGSRRASWDRAVANSFAAATWIQEALDKHGHIADVQAIKGQIGAQRREWAKVMVVKLCGPAIRARGATMAAEIKARQGKGNGWLAPSPIGRLLRRGHDEGTTALSSERRTSSRWGFSNTFGSSWKKCCTHVINHRLT